MPEADVATQIASEPTAQPSRARSGTEWIVLAAGTATIFAAAFLLFSLQPLVGKIVLPRFGGSAAVWSVCLVFFQTALLVGYALAYGIARLRPKQQIVGYALLWLVAALIASVPVGDVWRLTWFDNPAGELLLKLMRFVALPCVLVGSVSILVQVWARFAGVKDPYAFYAVSNVGSLGALLAYPTLIEPNFSVPASAAAWTWGFRIVALLDCRFERHGLDGASSRDAETETADSRSRSGLEDAARVDVSLRCRLGVARQFHLAHDAGHRADPDAVDHSALALSAHVHHLLRRHVSA